MVVVAAAPNAAAAAPKVLLLSGQPSAGGRALPLMVSGSRAAGSEAGGAPQARKRQRLTHLSPEEKALRRWARPAGRGAAGPRGRAWDSLGVPVGRAREGGLDSWREARGRGGSPSEGLLQRSLCRGKLTLVRTCPSSANACSWWSPGRDRSGCHCSRLGTQPWDPSHQPRAARVELGEGRLVSAPSAFLHGCRPCTEPVGRNWKQKAAGEEGRCL